MSWTCACCLKELPNRAIENLVFTEEGDEVSVGSDCAKKIKGAGTDGYYHDKSGSGPFYSRSAYEEL